MSKEAFRRKVRNCILANDRCAREQPRLLSEKSSQYSNKEFDDTRNPHGKNKFAKSFLDGIAQPLSARY